MSQESHLAGWLSEGLAPLPAPRRPLEWSWGLGWVAAPLPPGTGPAPRLVLNQLNQFPRSTELCSLTPGGKLSS